MIPSNTRIWIVAGLTDLRRGFVGLSAMVQTALEQNPLERGRFVWPKVDKGTVALTRAQLAMLLEGIDWRRPERTAEPRAMV